MSSYRGGPWDGGPPGAEAEYAGSAGQPAAPVYPPLPPAAGLPNTDPWTGVSYSQYGHPPTYDYQAYSSGYGYNYDPNYYRQDGNYYKYPDSSYPPPASSGYEYPPRDRPRVRSRSPVDSRSYDRRRRSYSRSVSPYEKRDRAYSRKRDGSYEGSRRGRSRSRSIISKRKYSSSDRSSSRSKSYLRSKKDKKRHSVSSDSSASGKSYKKSKSRVRGSLTPPLRKRRSKSRSHRTPSPRSVSRSPRLRDDKELLRSKEPKAHSSKEVKVKREVVTPTVSPKRHKSPRESSLTPPRGYKKTERSVTPPKSYKSSIKRSHRDSSLTPPKSYARSRSSSSSKSRSRSPSPRRAIRKRSPSSKSRHSSKSSSSSASPRRSRSTSRRRTRRKSPSKQRSRSPSRKRRAPTKSKSKSPGQSKSKGKKKSVSRSKSRSKSRASRSRSHSGTPSEDERRGQFTVADRKRFWKLHRSRQAERRKKETPPKELKPPPGAVEKTRVDDIEYGEPPEIEGPNFEELLRSHQQVSYGASTSKKNIPIPIKNDGSFLEMFKKLQEETKKIEEVEKKPEIKKPLPFIGKRRGGRVLKTGMVKKAKAIDEQTADNTPKDAWSLYMQEVKKYRETSCEEERKTRPLVK